MQEIWVWYLVREDSTWQGATKSVCHNYWAVLWSPGAATAEPTCHNYWSPGALEPVLHTREATMWKACTPQLENSPHSLQLGKNPCSNKDPAQPKQINKVILKKKKKTKLPNVLQIEGRQVNFLTFLLHKKAGVKSQMQWYSRRT